MDNGFTKTISQARRLGFRIHQIPRKVTFRKSLPSGIQGLVVNFVLHLARQDEKPRLRVPFSWPVRADELLYVVYVGPKITKH